MRGRERDSGRRSGSMCCVDWGWIGIPGGAAAALASAAAAVAVDGDVEPGDEETAAETTAESDGSDSPVAVPGLEEVVVVGLVDPAVPGREEEKWNCLRCEEGRNDCCSGDPEVVKDRKDSAAAVVDGARKESRKDCWESRKECRWDWSSH